jgi:hypothetical protein
MHMVTRPALASGSLRPYRSKLTFFCIAVVMMVGIALGKAGFLSGGKPAAVRAQTSVNVNCTLIVPEHPLSAQGLATPYQLVATDPAMGPCHEANTAQTAFVQSAVFDVTHNTISVYDPLVIDKGTKPAIPPVVPTLPKNAIVALWFGFNGAVLTLQDTNGSLREGRCVNGLGDSHFGQFAYCNAPAFFAAANQAVRQKALTPPPLGIARNGLECPSTRDFSVVDMDQSDNVTATYLALPNGQTAQNTAANRAQLKNFTLLVNPSDEKLLASFILPALGCKPWMVPNLADNGSPTTALPLNELQASVFQRPPVALVPAGDPMVLVNGDPNLQKLNLYRVGVDQPPVENLNQASTGEYCKNLREIAPPRLFFDAPLTRKFASPAPDMASNLFAFLALRFNATWGADGLNCQGLLDQPSPIIVISQNGLAIDAQIRITSQHIDK